MIIDDRFEIDAPVDRVWPVLCDVPRVAMCIPNAHITEVVNATTYRGKVSFRVGPIALTYAGTIVVEALDDVTHTATVSVTGDEFRGRGAVTASLVSRVTALGGKTRVDVRTDAQLSGIIETIGAPMIETVAQQTVAHFAANLAKLV